MYASKTLLETYRDVHGQPFVVDAEPVSDDPDTGYDVTLMPEMEAVSLAMYARRVYFDGEQISSEMGESWTGEPNVEVVALVDEPHGGCNTVVGLTSDEIEDFQIFEVSTVTMNYEEVYEHVKCGTTP